jgi:RNA polymerase sigma-70 factor (ECF subfamily)
MKASPKVRTEAIEACKAGDEKAFSEIVSQYQKRVFNLAYRMLGNREEAKDLAQEVFLSVFESIKGLKEEAKFGAWLTQITLNHCRNRWNHLKRRKYFDSDSINDLGEAGGGMIPKALYDPSDNPERLYEKKVVQQWVQQGLLRLREEERELIILRDLQGFSYDEMGEAFDLPEGTIKSKLHRARMALKGILEKLSH